MSLTTSQQRREAEVAAWNLKVSFSWSMPRQRRNGGVEIVNVDRSRRCVAVIVRLSIHQAGLDAAARHPNRETTAMIWSPP